MDPMLASNLDYDDTFWAKLDETLEAWKDKLFGQDVLRDVGILIVDQKGGVPDELSTPRRGAFNLCFHMAFKNGGGVPREVAVMRFLEHFTFIGIPHVFHRAAAKDIPKELGPFILMEYISHETDFIDPINTPGVTHADRPILYPDVNLETLGNIYGQIADVMLQMAKPTFFAIGCTDKANADDEFDDTWVVKHRPLTLNMNELIQVSGVHPDHLPQRTFKTVSAYYEALAVLHMVHLALQRNDAIDLAEDCRRKYIARSLFRKITRENKLSPDDAGPFKLYCESPSSFAYSPPWWLLLGMPESWKPNLIDWVEKYEKALPVFLKALKAKEDAGIQRGVLKEEHRVSHHIAKGWESGDFWVNDAAMESWAFDWIYWSKIDRRFFGGGNLEDRVKLLTQEERGAMDEFVEMKLKQKVDWATGTMFKAH
ncbi:hypothetical protein BDW74DRAFT_177928 [Aspergillus multicolor]|uniref:uncharacterized protein n=1 Tax=Aspergillus multicolor TaxID=41759 RepID=UPI003CCD4FA8